MALAECTGRAGEFRRHLQVKQDQRCPLTLRAGLTVCQSGPGFCWLWWRHSHQPFRGPSKHRMVTAGGPVPAQIGC